MTTYQLRSPGGASEAKQDEILEQLADTLAELQQKFEQGQTVALDDTTLTALENVNAVVSGTVTVADAATEAKQDAILVALAGLFTELQQKLEPGQSVALDGPTLTALENVVVSAINLDIRNLEAARDTVVAYVLNLPGSELEVTNVVGSDLNVADSGEREYIHIVNTVTANGDTTIHTPDSGKRIRLRWIYAINDPASASPPLIKVKLGAEEIYRVYALSKRQRKTGPIDGALVINLTGGGSVAVTAILEEV